jgi:hypothetical protein
VKKLFTFYKYNKASIKKKETLVTESVIENENENEIEIEIETSLETSPHRSSISFLSKYNSFH